MITQSAEPARRYKSEAQGLYPTGGVGRGVHDDLAPGRMPEHDHFLVSEIVKMGEQQLAQFRERPGARVIGGQAEPRSRTTVERRRPLLTLACVLINLR